MYPAIHPIGEVPSRSAAVAGPASTPLTAALFVDFENIYRALGGPAHGNGNYTQPPSPAAQHFAAHPERWLAWIEQGMPSQKGNGVHGSQRRSVLVRRCYLNPGLFGRSRAHFIRAAFSVIDCPTLAGVKNGADIHMVMDMLDTLEHHTHFDEFIIFSGDSDFTPVLLRLRAYNRRTTILTVGQAVEAYKAAADRVISRATFIEEALELGRRPPELHLVSDCPKAGAGEPTARSNGVYAAPGTPQEGPLSEAASVPDDSQLREQIVARVQQILAAADAPVSLAKVSAEVHREFGAQIKVTNWAGAGGFKKLLQSVEGLGLEITTLPHPGYLYDPARHERPTPAAED